MTKNQIKIISFALISAFLLFSMCSPSTTTKTEDERQLVRLALIKVDSTQIKPYNEFLKEEIEVSIRLEPGVITLYGIAEKDKPTEVTLFETYADSSQYRSHLATPHFQKYKQGTLQMVKHLDLIQMEPILYHRKADLSNAQVDDLYIRLIKIELDSSAIKDFNELGNTVMLPGIKNEPGVLVMYAAAEKDHPTRVSILEVYANSGAYNKHLETRHYQQYKQGAKTLVKSLKIVDANPILLGSKPQ
ncbi:MAG TPA: antibiotic biosynthesis monooxygenase [Chryseosolibacter sp.]